MLLVYDFEPSAATFVNQVATTPYCFHVSLPVRTGITTFRNVRISANTASFSQPVKPSPRGYFFPDPRERVITVEVVDDNWMQSMGETAELYVPARTFLAYIAAHPPSATKLSTATRSPPVDVPWEAWGPRGSHLVRTPDQTHIIRRPRACGMRVLGASLSEKSVVVTDFHPGRVARSARVGVGTLAATGTAGTTSSATSARARAPVPSTFSEMQQEQGLQARRSALVCATKEVPLPRELRDASESPWMMLCEDALLAFEVSGFVSLAFLCVADWIVLNRMISMLRMGSRSAGCSRTRSNRTAWHALHSWRGGDPITTRAFISQFIILFADILATSMSQSNPITN